MKGFSKPSQAGKATLRKQKPPYLRQFAKD